MSAEEVRLDKLLMQRGFASSRQRAVELIKDGSVLVNSKSITKPGQKFPKEISIDLTASEIPWVSRGALKLEAALDHWQIDPFGLTCLDVGASTGGFTELLLDRGAKKVYAVDTGSEQLAPELRNDPRVASFENTDIRNLSHEDFTSIDLIVIDVSFISLELIFPALVSFCNNHPKIIALIKPQFEVGRENVGKRGVVRDEGLRHLAVEKVKKMAEGHGWQWVDSIKSPITGGEGNVEFLGSIRT
ncbi:TlyA family RNA methyltransferase [Halocola ammonii]